MVGKVEVHHLTSAKVKRHPKRVFLSVKDFLFRNMDSSIVEESVNIIKFYYKMVILLYRRGCVPTPLDFFRKFYAHNLQNLEQLKTNILLKMRHKVIENYLKRIQACKSYRGGHFDDVVFHV